MLPLDWQLAHSAFSTLPACTHPGRRRFLASSALWQLFRTTRRAAARHRLSTERAPSREQLAASERASERTRSQKQKHIRSPLALVHYAMLLSANAKALSATTAL